MKEKVVLRSAHPEEYPDLTVECLVIPNAEIGDYVASIPEEDKLIAYKNGMVMARTGIEGEPVHTELKTTIDGREYILSEEDNVVRNRDGVMDVVVTNVSSTSNERYVVKGSKFAQTYTPSEDGLTSEDGIAAIPTYDPRELARVSENVIIMTSWGAPAVCLAGSYIVTYNADANDYNTIEQGAFASSYTVESGSRKRK